MIVAGSRPTSPATLVQHVAVLDELVGHHVDVDLVGVASGQPERHLLAVAADEQRDVIATAGARRVGRVADAGELAGERDRRLVRGGSGAR